MTTQTDASVRRVFRYADKVFPDPGAEYSVEQVLQHLRTFFPELGHARTEEKTLPDGTQEITFSKQVTRKGALPAPAAAPAAIDILVTALTAVAEYDSPLNPVYEVLIKERPLTLHTLRQHTQLLHDHADQMHDQTFAVNKVILPCKRLAPTPLLHLPLGF
jgi:PRTRC genetic system protein C